MDAVVNKLENILKSTYDIKKYIDLARELFPKANLKERKSREEKSNFSSHIKTYTPVGYYNTPDKKSVVIMAAELKAKSYVENSRSIQRNYAKIMMERAGADAAFIAFYTEGKPKWRLSLVRLDYEMKIENGRLKAAEKLTPAKRYSYLVGEDEPCHTAVSRFERFIIGNMADPDYPTLDALEEIFSVEKVTDEFFRLYCEKFHQLRESLEENEDFRNEAERHNFTSAQFAKKLMGQIVFLYFLQKKGWLGVKVWPETLTEKEYKNAYYANGAPYEIRQIAKKIITDIYSLSADGNYKLNYEELDKAKGEEALVGWSVVGKPWGSGPHNFMRKLFEIAERKNQNFFDELLEPLFYNTLNVNRGEEGYCPELHCRMPFLSGGLFEPIDNYDWKYNKFNVPNEIFSNVSTKGREADGILDIFDRYNFTMSEDEPMEREVAIDPEMLGKVFENLLEINDRKSKGAFYTPREIVHYMCQESLINYLTDALKVDEESIREFILYGDFMKSEDTVKEKRQGNGNMYISESLFKVGSDGSIVTNRLKDMDEALKEVRIADPAVGSGAFPVGMLNEIVRARQNISAYMAVTMKQGSIRDMYKLDRSPYNLKYETIKNCIFAIDIEPSAVDIAQLRLWLSLVIDDEIKPEAQYEYRDGKRFAADGHREPSPLPNLECNILCGNSLIDEFEGIKLIKESELFGDKGNQLDMDQARFEDTVEELIEKQNELFRCKDTKNKEKLKNEIEIIKDRIIMSQLEFCDAEKVERYKESTKLASKPYVLWQLDFARVFREKGGFDIVIGNPPYVGEKGNKEIFRPIAATEFGKKYYYGKMDLFYFFFHKAIDIGNSNAEVSFITTNYYPTAFGGKRLRIDFKERTNIRRLINFNELRVFESALGQHNMITMLTKKVTNIYAKNCFCKIDGIAGADLLKQILYSDRSDEKYFNHYIVSQEDLYDGDEEYIRLSGINSNLADSIDSVLEKLAKSEYTLKEIAYIKQGIVSGADKYTDAHENKFGLGIPKGTGIFILKSDELLNLNLPSEELQYVKQVYKNSEISKYHIEYRNELSVLYMAKDLDISKIPNIIKYLEKFKLLLGKRLETYNESYPWWALHREREKKIFESPEKIVNSRRAKENIFAMENKGYYEQSDLMITVIKPEYSVLFPPKYILGLLNSKLYYVWLKNRGKLKGELLELYGKPLEEIPIKKPSKEDVEKVIKHVTDILNNVGDEYLHLKEIDSLIYDIQGLSDKEKELVEQYD